MGMLKLAIMGIIVIVLLIALVQPIMLILSVVGHFLNPFVLGVLMLIGVVTVLSFFWYAGESIAG